MVKVYRPDGVEQEKDTVDARECVEHCGYRYEPLEPDPGDPEKAKKTQKVG